MGWIYERMPVVHTAASWPVGLGEQGCDVRALLRSAAEDVLRTWPVSRDVNSPRHNRADLLDRIELPDAVRDGG
jgi:putative SOS response-associated peptidase YedK